MQQSLFGAVSIRILLAFRDPLIDTDSALLNYTAYGSGTDQTFTDLLPTPVVPQVKQHVGLLVQDHFDVTGVYHRVIHLVPLSVTGLRKKRNKTEILIGITHNFTPRFE